MRPAYPLLVLAAAAATCSPAGAIGLGPVRSAAVLGQPLDLPVPMRLDDGETVSAECISAEVIAGEQKLPPGEVRIVVENGASAGERIVRVRSSSVILEPIVTVAVAAGCPLQLLRRFTVFADPPPLVVASPVVPQALPVAAPAPAAPAASAGAQLAGAAQAGDSAAAPAPAVRAPRPRPAALDDEPTRAAAPRPVRRPAAAPQAPRPQQARSAAVRRPALAGNAQPRLRLDADTSLARRGVAAPGSTPPAPATTAGASPAASAALLAAAPVAAASAPLAAGSAPVADPPSAAADPRMVAMEAELAKLRAEAKANRDALLQLRSRVDDPARDDLLMPGLAALAALLALLAAWLAWRLRKLSRERQPWWDSRAPVSAATVEMAPPADAVAQPAASVPAPPVAVAAAAAARRPDHVDTMPLAIPPAPPAPEMSVDEQIDLEQQADFFLVLGQEDSAIELLHANLRATQGASPVPYLKLLDIHRRSGDREAYDALRERFNQRFNGIVPAIQVDARAGRSLEAYPDVLERLQAQWPRPVDALATLEALLFKRGDGQGRFELPAYRELLSLHQLARELAQDGGAAPAAEVDLLLPLGDDGPALHAVLPSAFEKTAVLEPGSTPPLPPRALN